MKNLTPLDFDHFSKHPIFFNLDIKEVEKIFAISKELALKADDFLMHEDDFAESFYIIFEGSFEIFKFDSQKSIDYSLLIVKKDEIVGEMGMFGERKRTASVKSLESSIVREIKYTEFENLLKEDHSYYKIFMNFSNKYSYLIQKVNSAIVDDFKKRVDDIQKRKMVGSFMVYTLVQGCLYFYFIVSIPYLNKTFTIEVTSYLQLLFYCTVLFTTAKIFNLQELLSFTKFNFSQWKKSSVEAILFTTPIIVGLILLKLFFIQHYPSSSNHSVLYLWHQFDAYKLFGIVFSPKIVWIANIFIYLIFSCFLQEVLTKTYQSILAFYLDEHKNKNIIAILVTSLGFSCAHLHIGFYAGLVAFFVGFYLSWLYFKQKNLVGCTVAHGMIGVFGLYIIGIPIW